MDFEEHNEQQDGKTIEEDIENSEEEEEELSIEDFERLYFNNHFTNNIIEQLTEISLQSKLKWFCPNNKCYFNTNAFNEPLIENIIDNSNILFVW